MDAFVAKKSATLRSPDEEHVTVTLIPYGGGYILCCQRVFDVDLVGTDLSAFIDYTAATPNPLDAVLEDLRELSHELGADPPRIEIGPRRGPAHSRRRSCGGPLGCLAAGGATPPQASVPKTVSDTVSGQSGTSSPT